MLEVCFNVREKIDFWESLFWVKCELIIVLCFSVCILGLVMYIVNLESVVVWENWVRRDGFLKCKLREM